MEAVVFDNMRRMQKDQQEAFELSRKFSGTLESFVVKDNFLIQMGNRASSSNTRNQDGYSGNTLGRPPEAGTNMVVDDCTNEGVNPKEFSLERH
nr:uncharacterized protein LOC112709597 [Arachis hypogaea]